MESALPAPWGVGNRSVFTPKRETLIHFSPLEKPKTHRVALMNVEGIPVSQSWAEDRCAVLKEKIEPEMLSAGGCYFSKAQAVAVACPAAV